MNLDFPCRNFGDEFSFPLQKFLTAGSGEPCAAQRCRIIPAGRLALLSSACFNLLITSGEFGGISGRLLS